MGDVLRKLRNKGGEHIVFVGATILSSGVNFLYSIYVKAYISPLEYGIYSTCMLLQVYMAYLQLGTLNAFNRDYPQLVGASKTDEAKQYSDTVFSFLLGIYLLAMAVVTFISVVMSRVHGTDTKMWLGFILASGISTTSVVENYGSFKHRIEHGFFLPSLVMLIKLMSVPLGIILIPRLGYYALYLTTLFSSGIAISLYWKTSFKVFKCKVNVKLLWSVLRSGLPLLVNGLIWTVVDSIDKFVILGFLDVEALGVYGIAQNAFSYMVLIPTAMSQLFYVQMGKEYGMTGEKKKLVDVSVNYATILAGITSIIAVVAYFFLPPLVDTFMPRYKDGVSAAQILILGLSIYAATLINSNILTLLKENRAILFHSSCMCIFNAICSILYIYVVGRRIESVALGTATSYIFCSFIIIYQVQKYSGCKLGKLIYSSVVPVCVSLAPCVVLYELISSRVLGFLLTAGFVFAYYFVCYRKVIGKILKELK